MPAPRRVDASRRAPARGLIGPQLDKDVDMKCEPGKNTCSSPCSSLCELRLRRPRPPRRPLNSPLLLKVVKTCASFSRGRLKFVATDVGTHRLHRP